MRISQMTSSATSRYLTTATNKMNKSAEKIASGKRILTANDDIAGVISSKSIAKKITGLETASEDLQSKQSLLKTADKTLNTVLDLAQKVSDAYTKQSTLDSASDEYANLTETINTYSSQISDLLTNTKHNGKAVFGAALTTVQNGETASDKLTFDLGSFAVDSTAAITADTAATTSNATVYNLSFFSATDTASSIAKLSKAYAKIGAYEDVTEAAIDINSTSKAEMQDALSRIVDVDEDQEAMNYNIASVLQTNALTMSSKQNSNMLGIVNLLA